MLIFRLPNIVSCSVRTNLNGALRIVALYKCNHPYNDNDSNVKTIKISIQTVI